MNEQLILAMLNANPAFKEALKNLLLKDEDKNRVAQQGDVFVWCAEMYDTTTQIPYYHPIVIPSDMTNRDLDTYMQPSAYKMAAYSNQFEANRMRSMISALNAYNVNIMLISISQEMYRTLELQLHELITQVLTEIEKCFNPLDRVAQMTNIGDPRMLKLQLLGNVLSKITTTSYCFDENMILHNSDNHEYHLDEPEFDDGEYDEDGFDEEPYSSFF